VRAKNRLSERSVGPSIPIGSYGTHKVYSLYWSSSQKVVY
jgi:hypothetical protein